MWTVSRARDDVLVEADHVMLDDGEAIHLAQAILDVVNGRAHYVDAYGTREIA